VVTRCRRCLSWTRQPLCVLEERRRLLPLVIVVMVLMVNAEQAGVYGGGGRGKTAVGCQS